MKKLLLLPLLVLAFALQSQNTFTCLVRDSLTGETLIGANVALQNTTTGTVTDLDGKAILENIPNGTQTLVFSYVGYKTQARNYVFPLPNSNEVYEILLSTAAEELEQVVISSSRTNARIEDLPVKVEVLGQEEMDEESTLVPGGIGSILGDLSVITIQRTNAVNGNDVVRMQGLDARYTQILRDGLPLYGGFSGSLGVLSIPPLDLKQVEIIKGSVSTLYGGGAIGGLINFISKTPGDKPTTTLIFNGTTLGEGNLNAFTSSKSGKVGLTVFAGSNVKFANDVNDDGFAEAPFDASFTVHPRLFFDLGKTTSLNVGFTGTYDRRKGGDLKAIQFQPTAEHPFLQTEEAFRSTLDLQFQHEKNNQQWTVKSAGNVFDRTLTLPGFQFQGRQINTYTEVNDLMKWGKSSLVAGVNLNTETFTKENADPVPFGNYENIVSGVFTQHDWQATERFSIETGLRFDHHNRYGNFVLPRLAFFYKPMKSLSARLAFGTGYKAPSLFDLAEPSTILAPISKDIKPEKSYGFNADVNYHTLLGEELGLTLNQALYFTNITHANLLVSSPVDSLAYIANSPGEVRSYGTDTYIQMDWRGLELYLGFNYTEAFRQDNGEDVNLAFNPKNKISTVLAYEIPDAWRMGIEAAYSANQYVEFNRKVSNFWFFAAMVERKFSFGSLVLNCENLFDARQSKYEPLVTGGFKNPVFATLWAPVEGRVVNLALRVKL